MCCEAAHDGDIFHVSGEHEAGRAGRALRLPRLPALPSQAARGWLRCQLQGVQGPSPDPALCSSCVLALSRCPERGHSAVRRRSSGSFGEVKGSWAVTSIPGDAVVTPGAAAATVLCPRACFNPRNSSAFLDIHFDVVCGLNITYDRCSSHCFQLNLAC